MGELVARHEPELAELALAEVGEDPFALADEGTAYAQPAILCASLAGWTGAGRPEAAFFAGHSLGELSALAAGRRDRPRRRRAHGRAPRPADAGRRRASSPAGCSPLLGDAERARAAADGGEAVIANDNGPTQIVVAGPPERARRDRRGGEGRRAADDRARRPRRLPHRGDGARLAPFREALGEVEIERPGAPVFSSVYATSSAPPRTRSATSSRRRSCARFAGARRSRRCTRSASASFVDAGPGKTLAGMVRRAFDDVEAEVLADEEAAHA